MGGDLEAQRTDPKGFRPRARFRHLGVAPLDSGTGRRQGRPSSAPRVEGDHPAGGSVLAHPPRCADGLGTPVDVLSPQGGNSTPNLPPSSPPRVRFEPHGKGLGRLIATEVRLGYRYHREESADLRGWHAMGDPLQAENINVIRDLGCSDTGGSFRVVQKGYGHQSFDLECQHHTDPQCQQHGS